MTFKEIKSGYPTYHLNRNSVSVSQGKVTIVSAPHVQPINNNTLMQGFSQTQPLVVDVTIEENGNTKTYSIPENLDTTYAGDIVIATSRDCILREVEALKSHSEDIINSVKANEDIISKCNKILTEWNPAYKERKETEARFGAIESDMKDMKAMMKNLIEKLA